MDLSRREVGGGAGGRWGRHTLKGAGGTYKGSSKLGKITPYILRLEHFM